MVIKIATQNIDDNVRHNNICYIDLGNGSNKFENHWVKNGNNLGAIC